MSAETLNSRVAPKFVVTSSLLGRAAGVRHGFTTRIGGLSVGPWATLNLGQGVGDSPRVVHENLRLFWRAMGAARILMLNQAHGTRLLRCDETSDPRAVFQEEADGMVTNVPGIAVAVRSADCVPILIAATDVQAVAAVHAGWRGTAAGIAREAVASLTREFGADPRHMVAAIGPSIGPCCFQVGGDVAEQLRSKDAMYVCREGDSWFADLAAINRRLLLSVGVPGTQVESLSLCTSCREDLFFSHRRDKGVTGRHLSYIYLLPPDTSVEGI